MLDFIKKPDSWLSIITAITAVIAIYQSYTQVKISNKQKLYEIRIEKYLIVDELIFIFENNRSKLDLIENSYEDVKPLFISLTNATLLKRMRIDFLHPFDENDSDDFFEVSETLYSLSVEISLIWKEKNVKAISDFISDYRLLLQALHLQNAYVVSEIESPTIPEDTLQNKAKEMAEYIHLDEKVQNAIKSYDEVVKSKAIEKIRKQIRL